MVVPRSFLTTTQIREKSGNAGMPLVQKRTLSFFALSFLVYPLFVWFLSLFQLSGAFTCLIEPVESFYSAFHVYLSPICNLIRFQIRLRSFGREQQKHRVFDLRFLLLFLRLYYDGIV